MEIMVGARTAGPPGGAAAYAADPMPRPLRVVPALAVMALIWGLSATPNLGTGLGTIDLVLRKGAHVTIFGVLFLAWALAWRRPRPWPAAVIALAWAVVDELHQTAVPGRHGCPLDVAINAVGVGLAAAALAWWRGRRRDDGTRDRSPTT